MASKNLELFNDVFPNSSYREINPRYDGPTDSKEGHAKYQDSKKPINNRILSYDDIKDTKNRIGWIVPIDFVVVDIDDMINARNVFTILSKLELKFSFMKGKHGGHFIFKNQSGLGNGAHYVTSLGITIDTRALMKGYIILPENDSDRSWGTITNDLDEVPYFLKPIKSLKVYTDFTTLKDGDGRNSKLFEHFMNLKDYAKDLSIAEKIESIKLINTYILREPMSFEELENTILRDSIVNKESNANTSTSKEDLIEKLAEKLITDHQIISTNDDIYVFNGKYYRIMSEEELERTIHLKYRKSLRERDRKEVIKFVRLKAWVDNRELNKHWNEIVLKNGILNISDMKLYPHNPLAYNTIYIDHDFNPNVERSSIIESFFDVISNYEIEKKKLLYEVIGYCFIRKNVFEKFFICYGEGSTGKSTYLNLIARLLGDRNTTYLSLTDLNERYHPAELFGKLANIGDDISSKFIQDSNILKKLISGQETMIQQKYKRPISFSNFAKLIYTANRIPAFEDRTSGMMRRMMLIEINRKITNPDPFFLSKITEKDFEYLMYRALKGAYNLLKHNGFTKVESVNLALQVFRQSQSSVLSFISDNGLTSDNMDGKPSKMIYAEYQQYCTENGFKPLNQVNFKKEMSDELVMTTSYTTNGSGTPQQLRFKK